MRKFFLCFLCLLGLSVNVYGLDKKKIKTEVKKCDVNIKIEAISTIGQANAGEFIKVLSNEVAGCICTPLANKSDLKVIPFTCVCRKEGHNWEIQEGVSGE